MELRAWGLGLKAEGVTLNPIEYSDRSWISCCQASDSEMSWLSALSNTYESGLIAYSLVFKMFYNLWTCSRHMKTFSWEALRLHTPRPPKKTQNPQS